METEKLKHINNFIIDQRINIKLQEAIVKLTRLTIHSNTNNQIKELIEITELLQNVNGYCENPSLNYLSIKEKIQNDYYSNLDLEGTIIKCSFIKNACQSKMGFYPINFQKNG